MGRGLIHSESGVRYAWVVQQTATTETCGERDCDDEGAKSDAIVAWHRDGQITLTTHTGITEKGDISQKQLFAAIDQVLFCDFGDRGHIQTTTTVFSSFFFFIKNATITVCTSVKSLPAYLIDRHGFRTMSDFLQQVITIMQCFLYRSAVACADMPGRRMLFFPYRLLRLHPPPLLVFTHIKLIYRRCVQPISS